MKNNCLAIIPARGGSKRIPRKNIREFHGKPIIQYSIETVINSKLFDEIMVSTEDDEIAGIAKMLGASVPFLRSKKNADDFTNIAEVVEEVLAKYKESGKTFNYFCCILPTSPFITQKRIIEAFKLLNKQKYDSVFPVVKFDYPIQRALKIENNNVSMICPENLKKRSQDLIPTYHDSGMFYWMKTDAFLKQKNLFANKTGAIILSSSEAQDIDTEEDWRNAEAKYNILCKDVKK